MKSRRAFLIKTAMGSFAAALLPFTGKSSVVKAKSNGIHKLPIVI